ncbi:transcription factor bHLH153-like [Typha latifolia]|uniref:transcription factor bHLH153-like n=1 Tax=Typha latifolia TaxID=4733 RepID=UPI003C2BD125
MMMTTEIIDQKRRNYDSYFHSSTSNYGCETTKRLKTSAGGTTSPKEKKDKIGERVAALQQLVSPFGKSDTASVLQEASGYIKFLHDQLQVLSAPYLRATMTGKVEESEHYSLRSRGLCLVPVASTINIARSNGADLWAPVNSKKQVQR